jgi:hypothetical protein
MSVAGLALGFGALLALSGCASAPPVIEYREVRPSIPAALMAQQPEPVVPNCTDDVCVSNYMIDMHAWGVIGWSHLKALQAALNPPADAK